eukprot:9185552-Ditylum_brightwellii.AAC.1
MTYTDCDASACYDQVVPEIAVLAQYQSGLPMHAAKFFPKKIALYMDLVKDQQMCHQIGH